MDRYYIDCEFDGHNGPLLSLAVVRGRDAASIYMRTASVAVDPWVVDNVVPVMETPNSPPPIRVFSNNVGDILRTWFRYEAPHPVVVADSPVDIARFCKALSTGCDGEWASTDFPRITFEVHNVDCYPTTLPNAVQHNAWWDAMALRQKLEAPQ